MNNDVKGANKTIGRYGEKFVGDLLGAQKRDKEKGADLVTLDGAEIEVKIRQLSQPIEISLSQIQSIVAKSIDSQIDVYYAICFYQTETGERVGKILEQVPILEICSKFTMKEIFIFPLPVILLFMSQLTTTLKQGDKRSSNIGPIRTFFDEYPGEKSQTNKDGELIIYTIGEKTESLLTL